MVNRGNVLSLRRINSAPNNDHMDPGNGFLMRRGYTQVWCGWQHDVPLGNTGGFRDYVLEDANTSGRIAESFELDSLYGIVFTAMVAFLLLGVLRMFAGPDYELDES